VELAKQYSDRILGIQSGELVLDIPTSQLNTSALNHIYLGDGEDS
jgi:ABC-type phosphate/phosphonate transport system ATPase subunit